MTQRDLFYIVIGYLLGSILFAPLCGQAFCHKDITAESRDGNPGAANAFQYGGMLCGVCTLCGDLAKGFLPVWCYIHFAPIVPTGLLLGIVTAAPVIGHIFPVFYHFRGGKGIATSFGCLLGLIPDYLPVAILAAVFLFFSLILRVTPHYYRTILTYICASVLIFLGDFNKGISIGFGIIAATVLIRMLISTEEHDKMKVSILWKP